MKRKDLKLGNVIETRCGDKFVIGMGCSESLVLRVFDDERMTFKFDSYLDDVYSSQLDVYDGFGRDYDIVKIYKDISCLVNKEVRPIWERSPLENLEFDMPIWVKNYPRDRFVINLFKGIDKDGKVLAWNTEGNDAPFASWNFYKLFCMEALKND